MLTYYIIGLIVLCLVLFIFNPTTTRIRKINSIIQQDRSVCDYINSLNGWKIAPGIETYQLDGVKIIISSMIGGTYNLFITYRKKRPTNSDIKYLFDKLTNSNSPIQKAHRSGIPYDKYEYRNNQ